MSDSRSTTRRSTSPWVVAASFAAGALIVAMGFLVFGVLGGDDPDTPPVTTQPTGTTEPTTTTQPTGTTTTEPTTTTPPSAAGLPEAAMEMVDQIRAAAEAEDLETLADLALQGAFTASFGAEVTTTDELVELWETMGRDEVVDAIRGLISLPNWYETESRDSEGEVIAIYVTPRFMHEPSNAENRRLLEDALGADYVEASVGDGQYLGWRLGVTADGNWQFFVSGD
jgi:hypothetical protein